MAGPFAIAGVTAVLKDLLNDGLANHDLSAMGNVAVSALPPDRIPVTNTEERSQLNIFLFQVSPNLGWRNVALPSRGSTGERLTNPPLALDLRYLVTAYGAEEFHSDVLLGYAMQLLHEHPVLTRAMIRATLQPSLPADVTLPLGLSMLSTSDLADQVEAIKITPDYLNAEEMSRLWSTMQAKYRPTAVYQVSVVLIEADKTTRSPLPVLRQGEANRGPEAQASLVPPIPTIGSMVLPGNQPAARLGDAVTLAGHHFAGDTGNPADVTVAVQLVSSRLAQPVSIPVAAAARSDTSIAFTIPNTAAALPAGLYSLAVQVVPTGTSDQAQSSNLLPLAIAPLITGGLAAPVARADVDPVSGLGTATVTVTCAPEVRPEQRASIVLGAREALAAAHAAQTDTLTFVVPGVASGEHRVRLRIDGAESLLVDRSDPKNPSFDETQKVMLT
jgi:hypothetical protein